MAFLARLLPKGIVAQIITLIIAVVFLSSAIIYVYFLTIRSQLDLGGPAYLDGRLSVAATMLAKAKAEERVDLLTKINGAMPDIALSMSADPLPHGLEKGSNDRARPPFLRLPEGTHYWLHRPDDRANHRDTQVVYIVMQDGEIYLAHLPLNEGRPPGPALNLLITFCLMIAGLSLWAARALTGPLRALGQAAADHTTQSDRPFSEKGPREVRDLAQALNQMQRRIMTLLHERTRFLVAVSHDLRTPITRLRLRAELSTDTAHKQSTLNDLAQMESLIESTLLYLRNGQTGEPLARIDLTSLMITICDTYADIGKTIPLECPPGLTAMMRGSEIERAIINLVENALKYAGSASLRVSQKGQWINIDVEDEGPGIAPEQQEDLLQPFSRGDKARTLSNQNGFGLGFSICRAICESHGGSLSLINRQPKGLCARITLPALPPVTA